MSDVISLISDALSPTSALEKQMQQRAMAQAIRMARLNALNMRMPDVVPDDRAYQAIDISLKVWDVLTGLLDIAGAVHLAIGASQAATVTAEAIAASEAAALASAAAGGAGAKVTVALTVGEAITLAGPLVFYVGLWVSLGAPYLEIKQDYSRDRARRGVAQGVLVGAFGYSPERARGFVLRQPESSNNHWVPGLRVAAQSAYRMGFIAGYRQGRAMSLNQRKWFWKAFAVTLREERATLWKNDWRDEGVWDRWFWEAGGVFDRRHLKD